MDMEIYFPGGKRVFADYGGFTIETDQPAAGGGEDSAPAPFDLFLASIGTCAGIYALGFMQQRDLDPAGAKLAMRTHRDAAAGLVRGSTSSCSSRPVFPKSTTTPSSTP